MAGRSVYIEIACSVMTNTPYKKFKKTTSKQYATLVF